jgi:protein-tyrosine phosphatase
MPSTIPPVNGPPSGMHWAEERSNHGGVDEIPLSAGTPGRLWLCGKHFIGPNPEAALAYVDGTAVVCLNEPNELDRFPHYVEWLRSQPATRVLWWPIPDLYVPDRDAAPQLFEQLRSRLGEGQRLLMHCGAGVGRAGTIAAGILVTMGETPRDAVARVRAHRPMGGPEAGPQTEFLYWLWAEWGEDTEARADEGPSTVPPRSRR